MQLQVFFLRCQIVTKDTELCILKQLFDPWLKDIS